MDTGKMLVAGLIGGAVALLLGFLLYGTLLADFFAKNSGSATGVMRADSEMLWIPLIIGHLSMGLLFAVIFGRWASIRTLSTGLKAGAVIGLLVSVAYALISLGTTHVATTTAAVADIATSTVISAIVGGVVGWYYGRK